MFFITLDMLNSIDISINNIIFISFYPLYPYYLHNICFFYRNLTDAKYIYSCINKQRIEKTKGKKLYFQCLLSLPIIATHFFYQKRRSTMYKTFKIHIRTDSTIKTDICKDFCLVKNFRFRSKTCPNLVKLISIVSKADISGKNAYIKTKSQFDLMMTMYNLVKSIFSHLYTDISTNSYKIRIKPLFDQNFFKLSWRFQ